MYSARGAESGTIAVEAWGAGHCRITLDLARPGEARRWVAVLSGHHVQVNGPEDLRRVLARPSAVHGCALLPQSAVLAGATPQAVVAVEASRLARAASGLPASLDWQSEAGAVHVAWSDYAPAGGDSLPATVTETVGGRLRLTVTFATLAPRSDFTAADFAVKAPPAPATHGYGGGQ